MGAADASTGDNQASLAAGVGGPAVGLTATTNALALGWQMAELYHANFFPKQQLPSAPERLPGASGLKDDQQTGLSIDRVDARLAALSQLIRASGQSQPDLQPLRERYTKTEHTAQDGHAQVYGLHVSVLQKLSATDFRLGTAYALGRALADSCLRPVSAKEFKREFGHERLDNLRTWLNDLASALPDHSAKAVLQSLTAWEAWVANLPATEDWTEVSNGDPGLIPTTVDRQGQLWRSVLTGEKAGRDLLTDDDYLSAGRALIARTRNIAWNLLKHIGVAPLAGVVVAIVLAVALVPGGVARLATIAASVAAALGFTWKAVATALGKAAEKLERPLWGAELDAAIAVAVTYIPPVGPPAPSIHLLDETPFYLRVLHATGQATAGHGATIPEFTSALTARYDRNRRKGSLSDKWTLRAWRLRGAAPGHDDVVYWIAWAQAAGYVQTVDATHYDVAPEGERLAQIPRGQEGTTRAALAAARAAPHSPASGAEPEGNNATEPVQQAPAGEG
jgi:hypothetical protein